MASGGYGLDKRKRARSPVRMTRGAEVDLFRDGDLDQTLGSGGGVIGSGMLVTGGRPMSGHRSSGSGGDPLRGSMVSVSSLVSAVSSF